MKKTITSAGLLVLGAATLNAQRTSYSPAPELTSRELSKWWSVSASVRGFYDDNINTAPKSSNRDDESFGFEISPSIGLNWTGSSQTYLGLSYQYGYRWYENRPDDDSDSVHQLNARFSHAFTERTKIVLTDSFVSAQEPELIDSSGGAVIPLRSEGDNIHNAAAISLTMDLTEKLGILFSYSNNYYDYSEDGPGSYSALLDRIEHMGTINLRWQGRPNCVGILGYQYGVNDPTSNDFLPGSTTVKGEDRGYDSHYVYLGADHSFNSQLAGSIRLGAQFTSYDKFDEDSTSPYVDASLSYNYTTDSNAILGIRHSLNATDIAAFDDSGTPVLNQETTTIYGAVNHKITPKLTGSLVGQVQLSSFENGGFDGDNETFFLGGINLTYAINQFLSAELGYNYDHLNSDVPNRDYNRNRVYIGIRASY